MGALLEPDTTALLDALLAYAADALRVAKTARRFSPMCSVRATSSNRIATMRNQEWFRRRTWTDKDRQEFWSRLRRSRTRFHKAQYLRIQALHLETDADPPALDAALELLDTMLRDYPEEFEIAAAHKQRGSCLAKLGRRDEALNAFHAALDAESRFPGVQGLAYLDYAETVLQAERSDLYEDALSQLARRADKEPFPNLQYRSGVAAAFLCERLGRTDEARAAATRALTAAAKTESPFRYHRKLGLVRGTDADVQARLWRLAGRSE